MKKKIIKSIAFAIIILVLIALYYYGNIYRTNFSKFTNININDISRLEISILYYDKSSEEYKINDKEKIKQIMNILDEYQLKRHIAKEKLRVLGINSSYTSINSEKEVNRGTYIIFYMGNNIIDLKLSLNKYMFIWSDKKYSYDFEIVNQEYDINNIRKICLND